MITQSNDNPAKPTFTLRQMFLWVVLVAVFSKVFLTAGVVGFWISVLLLVMFVVGFIVGKLVAPLPVWIVATLIFIFIFTSSGLETHRTPPSLYEFPVLLLRVTPAGEHVIHRRGRYKHADIYAEMYSWLSFALGFAYGVIKHTRESRRRLLATADEVESERSNSDTCDSTQNQ